MSLKPRRAFITVIAVGEGETEGAFLSYVKSLYCVRGSGVQIKIDWTYGGSPKDIIEEAVRLKQSADYNKAFLLIDTDVPWPPDAIALAQKESLELIPSKPCVEGLLLSILNPDRDWTRQTVKDCKQEFHKFIAEEHKTDVRKYALIFSKELLESSKSRLPEISKIIALLTELR